MGYSEEAMQIKRKNMRTYRRTLKTFNTLFDKNITNKNELIIFITSLYLNKLDKKQKDLWNVAYSYINTDMTLEEDNWRKQFYKDAKKWKLENKTKEQG